MSSKNPLLRKIPKVDELLLTIEPALPCGVTHVEAVTALREVLERARADILSGLLDFMPSGDWFQKMVFEQIESNRQPSLKRLINATGVVLHTNFGRAPLAQSAALAAQNAAQNYTNLEYDLTEGERGSRHSHVEKLLKSLTGAQGAMVLNNNASAVMLMLSAAAHAKETVVSRGELVEIGGAFRVPDVMALSGSLLKEVGTTNKTRLSDYQSAIDSERTGALLKVHTSNFKIVGFFEEVELCDLVALGRKNDLHVLYDLGSGYLSPLNIPCLLGEPTVRQSVLCGADVVCFSGDKLLGGPQAGIAVGKKTLIDKMKKHPLARAMRIDKMTLAALEATLRLYTDPSVALKEIPALKMLSAKPEQLLEKAQRLEHLVCSAGAQLKIQIVNSQGQVGGGSAPSELIGSYALAVSPKGVSLDKLEKRLRRSEPAVVGRIFKDRLLLDMLSVDERDIAHIARALLRALSEDGQ